ncbi:MAG: DUF465 domain-containing protein [Pseudomonadota bacterium]
MLHHHLEKLSQRHCELDRKISEEMSHPLPNQIRLSKLKRQKLRLKEKIVEIQDTSMH